MKNYNKNIYRDNTDKKIKQVISVFPPIKYIIVTLIFILVSSSAIANNISVTGVYITETNIVSHYSNVQFTISWENSWRTSSAPSNWDAAWVFIKYRVNKVSGGDGIWRHAIISASENPSPEGCIINVSSDGVGAFIYRSNDGTGTFTVNGVQLQWNYGTNLKNTEDYVEDNDMVDINVFALEMVYVRPESFYIGDKGGNYGRFYKNNITTLYQITSESALTLGGSTATNLHTYNISYMSNPDDFDASTTQTLPNEFPKGYNAFYCMKCEISQQLYVDFLNMLTYTQQVARTPIPPNSAEGTYFYNQYRHKIKISSPGIENTIPAVYISDYPFVACANLSWGDITAHLDWCGLRPMTELEYEKSCRGPLTSVKFEFAYGTNSPNNVTGITNIGTSSEISQYSGQNLVGMRNIDYGPMRVGSLARDNYFNRESCGATYYGILDMSGNVSEFTITVGRSICRAFTGLHGNGMLNTNGDADVLNWPPGTSGMGWRGGAWNESPYYNQNQAMNISYRDVVNNPYNGRTSTAGGRGVRTEP